jgi:hypothetical protein
LAAVVARATQDFLGTQREAHGYDGIVRNLRTVAGNDCGEK